MYLTITVNQVSSEERPVVSVNAPHTYKSTEAHPGTLYYTRLPSNMREEDVIARIVEKNWDFVTTSEFNFLIVFVSDNKHQQGFTLVRDRYGSQRVLISKTQNRLVVTTDPRAVKHSQTQWNPSGLYHALASRITATVALEDDVSVLPLSNGLVYDTENTLDLIETGAEELKIFERTNRFSDQELINRIKNSIFDSYCSISPEEPVAVLLSGGVDSFILAATASKYFKNVIAYTPTWNEGENPELERAVVFAKKLGIEHHVVTITPEDFKQAFFETVTANGIPNRNYSSLILHSLLKNISEENILYGEYADTLFGSSSIKAGVLDRKYATLFCLVPSFLAPVRYRNLIENVKNTRLSQLIEIPAITEDFVDHYLIDLGVDVIRPEVFEKDKAFTRVSGIEFNLKTDCSQHMIEIETSALLLNKKFITPFYNKHMVEISNSLSNPQMFGPSELSIRKNFRKETSHHVKPLLKQLACQYIEPETIYKKKLGFPVPLKNMLKAFKRSQENQQLERCFEHRNPEEVWSAINFVYLTNGQRFGSSMNV